MTSQRKKNINFGFALIALSSFMPIVSIKVMSVFTLAQILLLLSGFSLFWYSKKKDRGLDKVFLVYFFVVIISSLVIPHYDIRPFWKPAIYSPIFKYSLLFFIYIILDRVATLHNIGIYKKYLYYGVIINFFWSIAQYFLFMEGIDLNEIVFKDLLGFTNYERVSISIDDKMKPTGLSWHTSTFAPIVVIGYYLSSNLIYRLGLFIMAGMSGSSTTSIGFLLCVLTSIWNSGDIIRTKKSQTIIMILLTMLVIFVFYGFFVTMAEDSLGRAFARVSDAADGDDSNAHVWYYLVFPEVWDNLSPLRKLVGFGIGNSGYMYTLLWNRFSEISSWVVESDYINILLSYGLIGFFLYYIWLFRILYHGKNISPQYGQLMGILIFLGIFYNVQYDGVLLFEMILCICIHRNINFFAHNLERKKE